MMVKYAAVSVALLLVCMCVLRTRSEEDLRMVKRGSVRACGKALSELLSFVCNGRYNEPTTGKRSYSILYTNLFNDVWSNERDIETDDSGERTQRGVVDECCHQSCNFSTLRSYCGYKK